ncbi:hypothetical protein Dsin_023346, partial [Dipteronia sinensis]
YDRLWTFYILGLQVVNSSKHILMLSRFRVVVFIIIIFIESQLFQAMLILAWTGVSPTEIFQKKTLFYLSSIFITAAFLGLLQSMIFLLIYCLVEVEALYIVLETCAIDCSIFLKVIIQAMVTEILRNVITSFSHTFLYHATALGLWIPTDNQFYVFHFHQPQDPLSLRLVDMHAMNLMNIVILHLAFSLSFFSFIFLSDKLLYVLCMIFLLVTFHIISFFLIVRSSSSIMIFVSMLIFISFRPISYVIVIASYVLTPYYSEETVYSKDDLEMENEDGISTIYYLQKIFPDEWNNFMERLNCKKESEVWENDENILQLRHWVSLRGQTLFRTVRGMMYYRRALKLQAFLDMADEKEILEGYKAFTIPSEEETRSQSCLFQKKLEAMADMKFTYVATCQNYGNQKRSGDRRATDILNLMVSHPSLRVAYIDEVEVEVEETEGVKAKKVYYSVLVKAVDNLDQEIYRIKLPGSAKLGEGKPENQNHAVVFTRGEALQAIDMNQDNYLEEAFKMRNLLKEFNKDHGVRPPSILGVREHIFTGSVSSLAWFMSNQETSFVTIGQRVLARPLKIRFHYGHPDVFDRIFHITRGGMSKASRNVNLSEDIFAGFNSILRRGNVTHHEYIQVGKGRDVGLNQISLFEAKVACGNGEQTLSRDIYRLGHHFDFFRMLSCYFTTIGFYVSSLMIVLTVYSFLYGRIYLSLSGLEESIAEFAVASENDPLRAAMGTQSLVQLGFLLALPMLMEIGLERGFRTALGDFIIMQLQLASVFFTFSLGTKAHYFGRTILHGGAKYRATGRGFVVRHEKFAENYRMYSRSHFVKGLELTILLICYQIYGKTANDATSYLLITISIWFLVVSYLFAPFLFNPSGFEWQKTVDDWDDWSKWISSGGGIGVPASQSWESWWDEEQEHLLHTGFLGRLWEIILSLRFFIYQYGIVYQLNLTKAIKTSEERSIIVYGVSWLVIFAVMIILMIVSMVREKFSADFQLMFRLLKLFLFIGAVVALVLMFVFLELTVGDIFQALLAFLPTGWAIVQISQACRPLMSGLGMWGSCKAIARGYDYLMGYIIFAPVAILAWFPFVSEFQTRLLFNQAFSRGLQIQRILAGGKKHK